MKIFILIILLTGCDLPTGMTMDEIIKGKDKCLNSGMSYSIFSRAYDGAQFIKCAKPEQGN